MDPSGILTITQALKSAVDITKGIKNNWVTTFDKIRAQAVKNKTKRPIPKKCKLWRPDPVVSLSAIVEP